jgi:hypothetical protein
MIVVAGEARSGTSMHMLILRELGLQIAGDKFHGRGADYNPTGIWEVYGVPNNGITQDVLNGTVGRHVSKDSDEVTHEPITGDVIKLTTTGLVKSDPTLITKVVYCIRDPREIIVSQRGQIGWDSDKERYNTYLVNMARLFDKIEPQEWEHIYVSDYADMMWSPGVEVNRLATFLGVEPTKAAIDVIDPSFYRSKKHQAKHNKFAEKYYQQLRYYIKE